MFLNFLDVFLECLKLLSDEILKLSLGIIHVQCTHNYHYFGLIIGDSHLLQCYILTEYYPFEVPSHRVV